MIALLMVLFLLVCFCLVVVVLLQAGKGGGLAAGFGGAGTGFELLGGRQTATFLHQATRWLGGAFIALAFLIALLTSRTNRPGSLIQREFEGQPQPVQEQAGAPQDLQAVVDRPESAAQGGAEAGTAPAAGEGAAEPAPTAAGDPAAGTPPPGGAGAPR